MSTVTYSDLIDRDFVFELAKRGKVHLTSTQISITVEKEGDLSGLVVPPNTHLEYIYITPGKYEDRHYVTLRWVCEKRDGVKQ